jgi:competence protein ComFC
MPGSLAYRAYHLIWVGLDWLFPPDCGGCGKQGTRWCNECLSKSHVIGNQCCEVCGDVTVLAGVCARCQGQIPVYTRARSWAIYQGPVRNMVHRLKYKGDLSLGEALAQPLIADLTRIGWAIDVVAPVPLSLARMAERGYNQAALIAYPIAIGLTVPYQAKLLRKVRDTRSQVGLSYDDRLTNVVDAFFVDGLKVSGMRVLLVDDVTTSGATLNECARVLKKAGADEVYGYTFARATHNRTAVHSEIAIDSI